MRNFFILLLFIGVGTLFSAERPATTPSGWTDGAGGAIATLAELRWLSETTEAWDEHWVLGADIDATETEIWNNTSGTPLGFSPIGDCLYGDRQTIEFSGSLDGQGYTISNLYINRPNEVCTSLIGYLGSGSVTNINLSEVSIIGEGYSGAIVGWADHSTITNCSATGAVSGDKMIGGAIGRLEYSSAIHIHSTVTVTGNYNGTGGLIGTATSATLSQSSARGAVTADILVGGLLGTGDASIINESFATGAVTAHSSIAGGLIGSVNTSQVSNCFASGSITSLDVIGGIIGRLGTLTTLKYSYATGAVPDSSTKTGGIVGYGYSGSLLQNEFDSSTTGTDLLMSNYENTTDWPGLATAEFATANSFPQWDFISVWEIDTVVGIDSIPRPYLQWQANDNGIALLGHIGSEYSAKESVLLITFTGQGSYALNDTVTISASAIPGYVFSAWILDSDTVSTTETYSFTIDTTGNRTYHAHFETDITFAGGDGSTDNPYQIATLEHLSLLSSVLSLWDKHFLLTADIDASETRTWNIVNGDTLGFSPIGDDENDGVRQNRYFTGSFDGQGHIISNLYINRPKENYIGFFGFTSTGTEISQLTLADVDITGRDYTGGLAGLTFSTTTQSAVTGSIHGNTNVGGVFGFTSVNTTESYAVVQVKGYRYVGGFAGTTNNALTTDCFSAGTVEGTNSVGGFIGQSKWDEDVIRDNYSTALVISSGDSVGGFLATHDSSTNIYDNFYDTVTSGQSGNLIKFGNYNTTNPTMAYTGIATAAFAERTTFEKWNMYGIWGMGILAPIDSVTRPYFSWMLPTYSVTFIAGDGGTIPESALQQTTSGWNSYTVNPIPNDGFRFAAWVNAAGDTVALTKTISIKNVKKDTTLYALFSDKLTVTFTARDNGTIEGDTLQRIAPGNSTIAVTAVPTIGYQFSYWSIPNIPERLYENPLIITDVRTDSNVIAHFSSNAICKLEVVHSAHGTIAGEALQYTPCGDSSSPVTAVPNTGYDFDFWMVHRNDSIVTTPTITIVNSNEKLLLYPRYKRNSTPIPHTYHIEGGGDIAVVEIPDTTGNYPYVKVQLFPYDGNQLDSILYNGINHTNTITWNDTTYEYRLHNDSLEELQVYFSGESITPLTPTEKSVLTFTLSPDPATGILDIHSSEAILFTLYTLDGSIAIQQLIHQSQWMVSVQHLPPGTYAATAHTQNARIRTSVTIW